MPIEVPDELVQQIRAGECVAFVGAGFSAAAGMPGWRGLLAAMADVGAPRRPPAIAALDELLRQPEPPSHLLEMVAQVLQDELGHAQYIARLQAALTRDATLPPRMRRRLDRLKGIPFRAIVTTNFDPLLCGPTPGPETYRQLLRPSAHRWWDRRFWPGSDGQADGPLVVKLHGEVSERGARDVVFTRREYRSRLHGDPAYYGTLHAMFATSTVLYLGYSMSDAYLDYVRGELLEAMCADATVPTLAWAVLPSPTELERTYYARHEGIVLIPYDPDTDPPHGQFDELLDILYELTNPIHILASRLRGRRVMWMDPNREWNETGMRFLTDAVRRASELTGEQPTDVFVRVDTVDHALRALDAERDDAFDLLITRWGHDLGRWSDGRRCADAEVLLRGLAERRARGRSAPPVVVFATGEHADANKPVALRAGAFAYTATWETLFQTLDELLSPGHQTL